FVESLMGYSRAFLAKYLNPAVATMATAVFNSLDNEFLVLIVTMCGVPPDEAERRFAATRKNLRSAFDAIFEDFLDGLPQRDGRGAKAEWNAATLRRAIDSAAPHVPAARWSYRAIAERITQDMGLDPPLTGEALRKLIQRH